MLMKPDIARNRKQLISFLLLRWKQIVAFAAAERVYLATCRYSKKNDQPIPSMPDILVIQPCRQISIIKAHIIQLLPEVSFIDYDYEAPAPLNSNDFIEVYTADHFQCINKVTKVLENIPVT